LLTPGTLTFFLVVIAAGALVNSGLPLMIVSAQDLAPHAIGTASGLLMGFTWGTAGVLYIGIGWLQEQIGLVPAMSLSFLTLLPGAALAYLVLKRYRAAMGD
jgi:FSR family fosmidomycin resistance protein-like MFS transporter